MKNKTKTYNYNGSQITFEADKDVMINATEMAKPFNKLTNDWLKTTEIKYFLQALAERKKNPIG